MKHDVAIPDLFPSRPLDAEEILSADLTTCPPAGFPALPPRQAALVRRRVQNPGEPWTVSLREAGYSEGQTTRGRAQISAAGAVYLRAFAQSVAARAEDPAGIRAAALERLAREVREAPDGRVAVAAAKVLTDYLPEAAPPTLRTVADMSDDELLAALTAKLSELLEGCEGAVRAIWKSGPSATAEVNVWSAEAVTGILATARRFGAFADEWGHVEAMAAGWRDVRCPTARD